jgi:hypothetical protein
MFEKQYSKVRVSTFPNHLLHVIKSYVLLFQSYSVKSCLWCLQIKMDGLSSYKQIIFLVLQKLTIQIYSIMGARGSVVVKALCNKPESREFYTR